jgi:hypothetical protein
MPYCAQRFHATNHSHKARIDSFSCERLPLRLLDAEDPDALAIRREVNFALGSHREALSREFHDLRFSSSGVSGLASEYPHQSVWWGFYSHSRDHRYTKCSSKPPGIREKQTASRRDAGSAGLIGLACNVAASQADGVAGLA